MMKIKPSERNSRLLGIMVLSLLTAATVFSGVGVVQFSPSYEYETTDIEEHNIEIDSVENIEDMSSEQKDIVQKLENKDQVSTDENKFDVGNGNILVIDDSQEDGYIGIDSSQDSNSWGIIFLLFILLNAGASLLAIDESETFAVLGIVSVVICIGVGVYVTWVVLL